MALHFSRPSRHRAPDIRGVPLQDYVSGEQWAASHDYNHLLAWADLAAFTAGLSWIQLIELFKLTHQLSALLFALVAVMGDVMRFAVVLLVWQLGFSLTLYWLKVSINLSEGDEIHHAMDLDLNINGMHHATVVDLIYYVVMSSLALTGIVAILNSNWIVRGVYAVCVICTVVVLLNLLVSTMVSTYEVLQHSFYELAVKCRAELVVVAEERSLRSRRSKFFESLYFDDR